jgi:hypothetical protein
VRQVLIILLLLMSTPAVCRSESRLHYHDFNVDYPTSIVAGTELTFSFGLPALLSFEVEAPELPEVGNPPWSTQQHYYESDAAALGLDWSALESLMAGPPGKATTWGLPEHSTTVGFPLHWPKDGMQSYAKVDLDRITVVYHKVIYQTVAVIEFYGEGYAVPEPMGYSMLFAVGTSLVTAARCRRKR